MGQQSFFAAWPSQRSKDGARSLSLSLSLSLYPLSQTPFQHTRISPSTPFHFPNHPTVSPPSSITNDFYDFHFLTILVI
jgi:hypothetical protein